MKPTKENLALLKKLGFTRDKHNTGDDPNYDWYSLPNGWGFRLDAIRNFPELMRRLFVGQAENCINNGDDFRSKGWVLIPFEEEEYKEFKKIVSKHRRSQIRL